jgi:hypothetical protein
VLFYTKLTHELFGTEKAFESVWPDANQNSGSEPVYANYEKDILSIF